MSEIVIDTNVWVMANRITSLNDATSSGEADCIESAYTWLRSFINSDDRLAVDLSYQIMKEYRDNLPAGGLAEQELNQLESKPIERLVFMQIKFDKDGHAILPNSLEFHDESDRKFIAVALECDPHAPIYNSIDTDWAKEKTRLLDHGLVIRELCPDYIESRIHNT